jgi:fatty acid desaturase
MVIELVITFVVIAAACFVAIQFFGAFKSETVRAFIVVGYGLFTLVMLFNWFGSHIENLLSF